ncbi:MAG TPA: DUF3299 domain-containing protein [Steroidobacteraceae bacterium]
MKRPFDWIVASALLLVIHAAAWPVEARAQADIQKTSTTAQKPAAQKPAANTTKTSKPQAATTKAQSTPAKTSPGGAKGKSKPAPKPRERLELDWEELLPVKDRKKFSAVAPPPVHDYLGEGGPPAQQTMDFSVNPDLDGVRVKLPGFIVPLEVGRNGIVREFFLVPYFGACIHVPPPPPNQIVYVRFPKGLEMESIYEAHWVTGKMRIENTTTRLGAAAYALAAEAVEIYKY